MAVTKGTVMDGNGDGHDGCGDGDSSANRADVCSLMLEVHGW